MFFVPYPKLQNPTLRSALIMTTNVCYGKKIHTRRKTIQSHDCNTYDFCVQFYVTTQSPRSTALNNLQQHTQKRLRQQALNVRNAQFLGPSWVLLTNHIKLQWRFIHTSHTYISLFPTHVSQSEPTTGTGSAMMDGWVGSWIGNTFHWVPVPEQTIVVWCQVLFSLPTNNPLAPSLPMY